MMAVVSHRRNEPDRCALQVDAANHLMMPIATIIAEYGRARSPKLRRRLWIATKIATVLALTAGLLFGAWWWAVLRPYRQLQAMTEMPAALAASPAELRAAAHAALRFPGPGAHDAYVVLLRCGDASSVPVLIRSLRWQPHTPPNGVMVCTKAHCLEALHRLTGRDLGKNYEDWAPLLDSLPTSRSS